MNLQDLPQEYQDRIKRFDYLFVENTDHSFQEDSLFNYEMFVMEESLALYEHFKDVADIDAYLEEFKNAFEKENGRKPDVSDIVKNVPNFRYSEHSGNTLGASWLMFITYKTKPEMVKFLHGSLANLVGDKGYYDNREDVKNYIKEHEKTK
jgi:quinol monooxygenase YgiN